MILCHIAKSLIHITWFGTILLPLLKKSRFILSHKEVCQYVIRFYAAHAAEYVSVGFFNKPLCNFVYYFIVDL